MTFQRLPSFARPKNYKLRLKPDLDSATFSGEECIEIEILEKTTFVKLHCYKIEVQNASLKIGLNEHTALNVKYNEQEETIEVELPTQIQPGRVYLTLQFTGKLTNIMRGFYCLKYKTADGEEKSVASTQFESTYARYSYPCWDEPAYKANYDITLIVKQQYTALSNTNAIAEKTLANGWREVIYGTTPQMSSYLVAFAVGEFEYLEDKTQDGVIVRVYAVPSKVEQGKFALEVACKALDYYNDFFAIKYPLQKCDLIAIPSASMGAMENWGLLTCEEAVLLLDPQCSSQKAKSSIALTIGHELSHMWFGNLVTMKWWTDLWLKEGFANLMEYHFVADVYPEFDIWQRFVNDQIEAGFKLDALESSHPIEVTINNPNEVDEVFDSITYAKASSISRMLYDYLGHEKFNKGLREYLAKFQYSNAQTVDLWKCLENASGADVASLMSGWTQQIGFPLVTVESEQWGDKRWIKLSQQRFLADGSEDRSGLCWHIPVGVCTASAPDKIHSKLTLKKKCQEFELEGVSEGEWIKLNAGFTGYYRIQYPVHMIDALVSALKDGKLATVDRFNLLADLFALVQSGHSDAGMYLSSIYACRSETEYIIWTQIDGAVSCIGNVLSRTDLKPRFDAFVRELFGPIAKQLGFEPIEGENSQKAMLRSLVVSRRGQTGDIDTIDWARRKFQKFLNGENLGADLRAVIFLLVAKNGGIDELKAIQGILETTTYSQIHRDCVAVLAASADTEVQKAALDYALHSGFVRPQYLLRAIASACVTKEGQHTAWEFVKNNFDEILSKFGEPTSYLFQICIRWAGNKHCTEEVAKDIEAFVATSEHAETLQQTVNQTCEAIRLNATLLQRIEQPTENWLTSRGY